MEIISESPNSLFQLSCIIMYCIVYVIIICTVLKDKFKAYEKYLTFWEIGWFIVVSIPWLIFIYGKISS